MTTWLLLDTNYLCYRSFYTTGGLSYRGLGTGVLYGVLRDIRTLQMELATPHIVFCFDYGKPLRESDYLQYKSTRRRKKKEMKDTEKMAYEDLQRQVKALRRDYLPGLGFNNVLYEKGYEADDMIAAVCRDLPKGDEAMIVSADNDMLQLLSSRVAIYHPTKKKVMTKAKFITKYNISPEQWIDVKAMAGCKSDDIDGIRGVGEITAVKFLTGKLKATCKEYDLIIKGTKKWKKNKHIVKLPYPGLDRVELQPDEVTLDKWRALMKELGISAIADIHIRRKSARKGFDV